MSSAQIVALLTECTQYNCGRRCSLSGVLARKLSKSRGECFLPLRECADVLYIYLLNIPTDKSANVGGQTLCIITRPCRLSSTVFTRL